MERKEIIKNLLLFPFAFVMIVILLIGSFQAIQRNPVAILVFGFLLYALIFVFVGFIHLWKELFSSFGERGDKKDTTEQDSKE